MATSRPCGASTSRSARARSSRSWARTAPARRPPSRSSRATATASGGRGQRARHRPAAGRTARGATGSASSFRSPGSSPSSPRARRSSSTPATTPRPRDVDETIDLVGLAEKADARTSTLSGGQQRRLDVALALIGDPELLFLDEPTTGFDPSARRQAWDVIGGLRDLGKTVFLTTHYMDEAQALADRVAIISAGRIVAIGLARGPGRRPRGAHRDQLPASGRRPPPRSARCGARRRAGSTPRRSR